MTLLSPLCSNTLPEMRESQRGRARQTRRGRARGKHRSGHCWTSGESHRIRWKTRLSKFIMPAVFFNMVSDVYFRNTLYALTFLRYFNYGMLYKALWSVYTDQRALYNIP